MECSFFVAGRTLFFTASRVFKKLFLVRLLTAAFNDFYGTSGEVLMTKDEWYRQLFERLDNSGT